MRGGPSAAEPRKGAAAHYGSPPHRHDSVTSIPPCSPRAVNGLAWHRTTSARGAAAHAPSRTRDATSAPLAARHVHRRPASRRSRGGQRGPRALPVAAPRGIRPARRAPRGAALALARAEQAVFERVHLRLRHAASAVAEAASQDPGRLVIEVSGLVLDGASQPGAPGIVVHLVRSAVGPVPRPARRPPGSVARAAGGTAVLGWCLAPMGRDVRLSAALALEGLLDWYRAADPHLQPPPTGDRLRPPARGRAPGGGGATPAAGPVGRDRGTPQDRADGRGRLGPGGTPDRRERPRLNGSSSVRHTLVLPIDPRN